MQQFTNDVFSRVDTAVYGRLTYEAIVPWWADVAKGNYPPDVRVTDREIEFASILQSIRKVVVSRTIEDVGAEALVIRGDVVPAVAELKEGPGRDIVLHGGSGLVVQLAETDLIDEYMLFVSPAAIGAGKPLFSGLRRELPLRLLETRTFDSAFTLLRYEPARGA
jgi:dihydrofolate reductase